jgi:hypothetical protein
MKVQYGKRQYFWAWTNYNCDRQYAFNAAICTTISYTLWVEWYYLRNNYSTLRSKAPRRTLRYATHRLMVMHPHTRYHWPISKNKNVMSRTRKYYLIFFKQVKVPRRSLRYAKHPLMALHPHTKYNWPIWKDKTNMVRKDFAEKKQKKRKQEKRKWKKRKRKQNQNKTICLPLFEGET